MPLIKSSYQAPFLFKNGHLNTVYKTLFYKHTINYHRKRIDTPDDDFLDLDFSTVGSETMVIAMHGLEGSSQSSYLISVINYLNSKNMDCVAVNFRGCSGEDNNQLYSYHSGKTDDLETVINYLLENYNYKNIVLLGYSMGGNITLKYMGETAAINSKIKGAIAVSVPCDLRGSSYALASWSNSIYMNKFLKTLKEKTLFKIHKFPKNTIDIYKAQNANSFEDFDNAVTAPLFGYKNAEDYWETCSSKQFIPAIDKPTLLINALDDSFLSKSCFPISEAENNSNFNLELPTYGGHVGFNTSFFGKDILWSENRILSFINHIIYE
ncbi:MAG: alpha/beta fold hydrolase [Lutibacter sp.]|uniref:YheT family hydrolase n=1 Tax=Lutibacter sp. TaxID=1925666 RepID=UPI0019EA53AD|nr:alpha/beta fold hydrolase [Lutibacter sp.]NOR28994.1 alpha/beta fold hydrolase [Lutibacter sp.]